MRKCMGKGVVEHAVNALGMLNLGVEDKDGEEGLCRMLHRKCIPCSSNVPIIPLHVYEESTLVPGPCQTNLKTVFCFYKMIIASLLYVFGLGMVSRNSHFQVAGETHIVCVYVDLQSPGPSEPHEEKNIGHPLLLH